MEKIDGFYKHVGIARNTGKRIVVVFHQQPQREDHALVIDMDALPPRYHNTVEDLLKSHEGQNSKDFYDLISRRLMPDENIPVINALHNRNYLMSIPVDQVTMVPRPGAEISLRQLLEINGKVSQTPVEQQTVVPGLDPLEVAQLDADVLDAVKQAAAQIDGGNLLANEDMVDSTKHNQPALNVQNSKDDAQRSIASNLIRHAEMLEAEAAQKRKQANMILEKLVPPAKPKSTKSKSKAS